MTTNEDEVSPTISEHSAETHENTIRSTDNKLKDDSDYDTDEEDSMYDEFFESIRSETGLELGVRVTWPHVDPFELSTCLPADSIAPMFAGTEWAGTRVWRAAIVALQYLESMSSGIDSTRETTTDLNDTESHGDLVMNATTSVLELGCGLGVPGMILQATRGCNVLLTDKDSLVKQLEDNIQNMSPGEKNSHLNAYPLDWSKEGVAHLVEATGRSKGWDIVLNCDCIYEPLYGESWKYLADCQESLLELNPGCYMLTSVERRRADGAEKYLQRIQDSPRVERIEKLKASFDHPPEVELYRIFGKNIVS